MLPASGNANPKRPQNPREVRASRPAYCYRSLTSQIEILVPYLGPELAGSRNSLFLP